MEISLQGLSNIKGVRGAVYHLGEARRRTGFALRGAYNFARLRLERNGARPSVTAVVVGRNDDYMSDFRERLHATIEWNMRHLIDEVIFIEWNPPADRELLAPALAARFPRLRAYVVPPEIHDAVCHNPHVNLLEFHAKNVGVRRAATPWIVTTNADAVFGLDVVQRLRRASLSSDVVWTAERIDIPWPEGRRREIAVLDCLRYKRVIPYSQLGTGEFALASRELWHAVRGYDESMSKHRMGCDHRGIAQMLAHGAKVNRAGSVLHLEHPTSCTETRVLQPDHGEWAQLEGLPYCNGDDWGLGDYREVQLAERVWRLEK
jgi:hypothetical protein